MRHFRHRVLLLVLAATLLAGCTATVPGVASPGPGEPVDVPADAFPITGVSDAPIDQFARNALTDLNTFWSEAYPEFFGEDFTPLEGGYFSVDSLDLDESAYPQTRRFAAILGCLAGAIFAYALLLQALSGILLTGCER